MAKFIVTGMDGQGNVSWHADGGQEYASKAAAQQAADYLNYNADQSDTDWLYSVVEAA